MSPFVQLGDDTRRTVVREGAARLGILEVIVEKDYWVCWLLGRIFDDDERKRHIVFKGGTTLSKVFGAIQRFSEDIDLSVSPQVLGFSESTLDSAPSRSKRTKVFQSLQSACAKFVEERFRPKLEKAVREVLDARPGNRTWLSYKEDARTHSPVLLFEYPSTLPPERGYIEPAVNLEFGSLTDQQPTGTHSVKPLLADVIPDLRDESEQVVALGVERTFWEKATILHAEYHRPPDRPIPDRFARHYSDFAALWEHSAKDAALKRLDLLDQVATFKSRFFASSWANYRTARQATLKLSPAAGRESELQRDYAKMEPMFLVDPPPFAKVLEVIAEAQRDINTR